MDMCGVCLNAYSGTLRKRIACPYCSESACIQCMKVYVLDNASNPKCMHCHRLFTNEFVDTTFTKLFRRGDLRKRKVINLLDLEKSLIPETMPLIEEQNRERQRKLQAHKLDTLLRKVMNFAHHREQLSDLDQVVQDLVAKAHEVRALGVEPEPAPDKVVKYLKCPGCPGYIPISRTGQCSNCEYKICRSCRERDSELHTCNEETLKTMQMVRDLCKPCPKCGMQIERVSGCSQMFCTECHTAFSWTTGAIVSGPIHNPHYFEFIRRTGQDMRANNCEQNVGYIAPSAMVTAFLNRNKTLHFQCGNETFPGCTHPGMCRFFRITQNVNWILDWARSPLVDYTHTRYRHLRIQFIEGSLSEHKFSKLMGVQETLRVKKNRALEIYKMFAAVSLDVYNRLNEGFSASTNPAELFQEFFTSMVAVRQYAEDALRSVYDDYSDASFRFLNKDFQMTDVAK
jgi:hypothetical protein